MCMDGTVIDARSQPGSRWTTTHGLVDNVTTMTSARSVSSRKRLPASIRTLPGLAVLFESNTRDHKIMLHSCAIFVMFNLTDHLGGVHPAMTMISVGPVWNSARPLASTIVFDGQTVISVPVWPPRHMHALYATYAEWTSLEVAGGVYYAETMTCVKTTSARHT